MYDYQKRKLVTWISVILFIYIIYICVFKKSGIVIPAPNPLPKFKSFMK